MLGTRSAPGPGGSSRPVRKREADLSGSRPGLSISRARSGPRVKRARRRLKTNAVTARVRFCHYISASITRRAGAVVGPVSERATRHHHYRAQLRIVVVRPDARAPVRAPRRATG